MNPLMCMGKVTSLVSTNYRGLLTVNPLMCEGKVAEKSRICLSLGMNASSLSRALW